MYEYPDIFTTFLKDSILFQQVNGLTELRWDKLSYNRIYVDNNYLLDPLPFLMW